MSSFTGALILQDNDDGETFTVFKLFRYYVGSEPSDVYRDVKAGFNTNLASKPKWLRRTGKYNAPAVLHDALYAEPYVVTRTRHARIAIRKTITRKVCDEIFLEAMLVKGVNYFKAYAYYWTVRVAGAKHFNG